MSLQYSDTSSAKNGIIQEIEDRLFGEYGHITDNATRHAKWNNRVNRALDRFWQVALPASGTWQLDDSNQTDFPEINTDLVSTQRDYTFTTDESGNLILDIYKVFIATEDGSPMVEIFPIDPSTDRTSLSSGFTDDEDVQGIPTRYDKVGNGILLDPIPNYTTTDGKGLKVPINREASYFDTSDTTKKPGVPGLFHEYFVIKPIADFKLDNQHADSASWDAVVRRMEQDIEEHFGRRERDIKRVMTPNTVKYK